MKVRPATLNDTDRIAEIHLASWRTAFRGIMPDIFLDQQDFQKRKEGWSKNILEYPGNLMVIEGKNIEGFVCSGPTKSNPLNFDAEVFGIHVDPKAKRNGYGYQLMKASFERFKEFDCQNACLWTLEKNIPARNFYEKLGGALIAQKEKDFGGLMLTELAYGWTDLTLKSQ